MTEESTHSYYDWQVSTLMLAYDVHEPLSRNDIPALAAREEAVQHELHAMVHAVLPKAYLDNPEDDFPADMVQLLTRATLKRSMEIVDEAGAGADGASPQA